MGFWKKVKKAVVKPVARAADKVAPKPVSRALNRAAGDQKPAEARVGKSASAFKTKEEFVDSTIQRALGRPATAAELRGYSRLKNQDQLLSVLSETVGYDRLRWKPTLATDKQYAEGSRDAQIIAAWKRVKGNEPLSQETLRNWRSQDPKAFEAHLRGEIKSVRVPVNERVYRENPGAYRGNWQEYKIVSKEGLRTMGGSYTGTRQADQGAVVVLPSGTKVSGGGFTAIKDFTGVPGSVAYYAGPKQGRGLLGKVAKGVGAVGGVVGLDKKRITDKVYNASVDVAKVAAWAYPGTALVNLSPSLGGVLGGGQYVKESSRITSKVLGDNYAKYTEPLVTVGAAVADVAGGGGLVSAGLSAARAVGQKELGQISSGQMNRALVLSAASAVPGSRLLVPATSAAVGFLSGDKPRDIAEDFLWSVAGSTFGPLAGVAKHYARDIPELKAQRDAGLISDAQYKASEKQLMYDTAFSTAINLGKGVAAAKANDAPLSTALLGDFGVYLASNDANRSELLKLYGVSSIPRSISGLRRPAPAPAKPVANPRALVSPDSKVFQALVNRPVPETLGVTVRLADGLVINAAPAYRWTGAIP